MHYNFIFIIFFVVLIPGVFTILRKMNIERLFKQGAVAEIRITYIILTLIICELLTQVLERILYFI